MNSVEKSTASTAKENNIATPQHQTKRVSSKDVYDWALYELSSARRVEVSSGIDTSDLREQVVIALQEDLYTWLDGDDLTI